MLRRVIVKQIWKEQKTERIPPTEECPKLYWHILWKDNKNTNYKTLSKKLQIKSIKMKKGVYVILAE